MASCPCIDCSSNGSQRGRSLRADQGCGAHRGVTKSLEELLGGREPPDLGHYLESRPHEAGILEAARALVRVTEAKKRWPAGQPRLLSPVSLDGVEQDAEADCARGRSPDRQPQTTA